MPGFFVEFKKDNYNKEYFRGQALNERLVKAVLYVMENEK